MSNGMTRLAKLFKERDNKEFLGVQIGTVVSPFPDIKISILDGKAILTKDKLVWTSSIFDLHKLQYPTEEENQVLKVGNEVVLFPTQDEQTFFVYDKVVKK